MRLIRLSVDVASPYDVLGVDPDADEATIKAAYKRRVKEAHPDHGGSAEEFQRVRTAYETLKSEYRNGDGKRSRGVSGEGNLFDTSGDGLDEQRTPPRVEYLNYEVLDDHGWDIDDDGLFEKASEAGLDSDDYGRFLVEPDETLLEAAENRGFAWPYACRGGACANCAVAIKSGELSMPVDHILPSEMTERGIRLSCVGAPTTDEIQVIYNVKHLPELDELRLPPRPFERANSDD
jgi:curved DNA-binding protein CbpA